MERIMITGGCGFVGHHFVEHFIKNTDAEVVVVDKLSYAANGFERLRAINCFDEKRVKIFTVDLNLPLTKGVMKEVPLCDYIINLASESHVDNSMIYPAMFIKNNINLVVNMLEYAKVYTPKRFIQFSTDEVFGTAPQGVSFKEGDRFNPGNPYSASKAAQECVCISYANSYGIPVVITNTMNVIGERQHPEKFVPMVIRKVAHGERVIIHADKTRSVPGSRFYIHARNVAQAVDFIIHNTSETLDKFDASVGKFNIVGEREYNNLQLAQFIADHVGRELNYELVDFHSSRPGHDLRYALDGEKLRKRGWSPAVSIEESLRRTIDWTLKNKQWLELEGSSQD